LQGIFIALTLGTHQSVNTMKQLIYLTLAAMTLTVLLTGCTSSTMLQTVPSGAKVYVNEQYRGTTPLFYSDQKIVGSSTMLRFVLEGYQDMNTQITRDERVHVGALVGGFVCGIPWLWVMKYDPVHTWELQPLTNRASNRQGDLDGATLIDR
jgi:hypothetical protein